MREIEEINQAEAWVKTSDQFNETERKEMLDSLAKKRSGIEAKQKASPATKEEAQNLLASIDPSFRADKVESTNKTATQIEAHKLLNRIAPWAK